MSGALERFFKMANKYSGLIVDLCGYADDLSRAQILSLLDLARIGPADKEAVMNELQETEILIAEMDGSFSINLIVSDLINYYQHRGRMRSATFLSEQIIAIASQSDLLNQEIVADSISPDHLLDLLDNLYHLVRDVREAGTEHYIACMRMLGDLKRAANELSLDERLSKLEQIQRRHIEPLSVLINPASDYTSTIQQLQRRLTNLQQTSLLQGFQELSSKQRRVQADMEFINHRLLSYFAGIADTARTMLKSLMEEQSLKQVITWCLAHLPTVWQHLQGTIILGQGRNMLLFPNDDALEQAMSKVAHRMLLPRHRPLVQHPVEQSDGNGLQLNDRILWARVAQEHRIVSWPAFIAQSYTGYSLDEQLRALTLPQTDIHQPIRVIDSNTKITIRTHGVQITLNDFQVVWEGHR